MSDTLIVLAAVILMAALLHFEKHRVPPVKTGVKTMLSALFILTAVVQPHPMPTYYHLILIGLCLGLIGDVCLALERDSAFRLGLVAFLLGHVFYIAAFWRLTQPNYWVSPLNIVVAAAAYLIFRWLKPHLGRMLIPVAAYIIVITMMMVAAVAAGRNPHLKGSGTWLIILGAAAFYLSDLFVARDRFVKNEFINRLIGLPLYYAGQFMLAFSVGRLL